MTVSSYTTQISDGTKSRSTAVGPLPPGALWMRPEHLARTEGDKGQLTTRAKGPHTGSCRTSRWKSSFCASPGGGSRWSVRAIDAVDLNDDRLSERGRRWEVVR